MRPLSTEKGLARTLHNHATYLTTSWVIYASQFSNSSSTIKIIITEHYKTFSPENLNQTLIFQSHRPVAHKQVLSRQQSRAEGLSSPACKLGTTWEGWGGGLQRNGYQGSTVVLSLPHISPWGLSQQKGFARALHNHGIWQTISIPSKWTWLTQTVRINNGATTLGKWDPYNSVNM